MFKLSYLSIKFLAKWQEIYIVKKLFLNDFLIFLLFHNTLKNRAKEKLTEVRGKFLHYYNLFQLVRVRFNQNGFTIIELVVTLAIFGIMLAIALPSFLSYLPTMRLKGAARDISSTLQSARMEAVSRNANCNVSFDINNKSYTVSCIDPITNLSTDISFGTLSTDISFGWGTDVNKGAGGGSLPSDGVALTNDTCYFTSRGTVNSGSIYIKNTKNQSYALAISSGGRIDIRRWDGTTWVQ